MSKPIKNDPWYQDGLRFECTQCGECCTGEPGYVWVDDDEIAAMAGAINMDTESFESKYIRHVGPDKSLKELANGDCVLLDKNSRRCEVYAGRPVQCRTWPFWDSTLATKKDWKQTCQICPGAGKGTLYTIEQIEQARKEKSV